VAGVAAPAAAIVVTTAVLFNSGPSLPPEENVLPAAVEATVSLEVNAIGEVVFSGGDPDFPHLNPLHAVPLTNSDYGSLRVQSWKITTTDRAATIYSGSGDNVDEALAAMRDRDGEGEYLLQYSLVDASGNEYTLMSNFLIRNNG